MHNSRRTVLRSLLLAVASTALAALSFVMPSSASAATLAPPAVPPSGQAYLGAWVQPNGAGPYTGDTRVETELASLGEFQAELGRPLGLVHVYQDWDQQASNSVLNAISSTGAIPMIDWSCQVGSGPNGSTAAIVSGKYDSLITAYAQQLKAYGKPVFLRWLWEPNLDQLTAGCLHQAGNTLAQDGLNYKKAFRHIYDIFKGTGPNAVGATNVSFVWNPGLAGNISTPALLDFWPGYNYVNWIGIDGYSRVNKQQGTCVVPNPDFAQMFDVTTTGCTDLYTTLSGSKFAASGPAGSAILPMMIGETGATNPSGNPNHQRVFLAGNSGSILEDFQAGHYSDIKAICYYDGTNVQLGSAGTWTLDSQVASGGAAPSGFAAFAQLAASPNFSFLDPG